MMQNVLQLFRKVISGSVILWCISLFFGIWFAQVPDEYFQNYVVSDDWIEMVDTLWTLEATIKVGEQPSTELFQVLQKNFSVVFDYFPKSPATTQIYKQCEIITWKLAQQYTSWNYSTFKNKCFDDIRWIIWDISSKHTVKTKVVAKPTDWSSPLVVTFDAKWSSDPSEDTIPSDNFFWYYKDINWVNQPIGTGPVITHTFTDPGKHVVHVTVRSANNKEEWVFDWAETIDVIVSPKAADIVVYLNWKLMASDRPLKIDSQEAKDWFVIDWSATNPLWERVILSHTWRIKWNQQENRYEFNDENEWPPGQFAISFPYNWIYTVELSILDNENNKVTSKFEVSVSDPVSLINVSPKLWNTSTEYTFDWSASYSITSRVWQYKWTLIDPNGNQVESIDARSFKKNFVIPGVYTIQLVVQDELGNTSTDIKKIDIEATDPIPSFSVLPQSDWEFPSQFILDASGTVDEDVVNWVDILTYEWRFSNPDQVTVENIGETSEKVLVTFNEVWNHVVKLVVKDSFWRSAEVDQRVQVKSTLRPQLFITPITSAWWDEVNYASKVNKNVGFYQRDFGDWNVKELTAPEWAQTTHVYKKSWIYDVQLTVATTDNWEENTIKRSVFVWQKEVPVIAYEVKSWSDQYLQKSTECEVDWEKIEAYDIKRYETFQFSLAESINAQWEKTWLEYFITPQNDETWKIYEKSSLTYDFKELWCQYIDINLQDSSTWKEVAEKVWFDVSNNLPQLWNVVITFPQSQPNNQQIWIGVWVGNTVSQSEIDKFIANQYERLLVKVSATWSKDIDGQITRFIWYYYNKKSPEDWEDYAITPATVSSHVFSVPKVEGEYIFGVKIVDNDGEEISSEEILWAGPALTFSTPWSPNIPTIDAKVETDIVQVGEQVTFLLNSEILSNKSDFIQERYYKIDLDWDNIYDTPPIKDDSYSYIYEQPGKYRPKIKVVYRWSVGTDVLWEIDVRQWVKAQFVTDAADKTVLMRNISIWDIDTQILCADIKNCAKWSDFMIQDPTTHVVEYPDFGEYQLRLVSVDTYWNRPAPYTPTLTLEDWWNVFDLLSIPESQEAEDWVWVIVSVGSQLNHTISFYPLFDGDGNCFIDLDILRDSDWDEDPLFDQDVVCNELSEKVFDSSRKKQKWSIYYVVDGELTTIPLEISFLDAIDGSDVDVDIPSSLREEYERLNALIEDVEDGKVQDRDGYYFSLLDSLSGSVTETDTRNSILLQLSEYVKSSAGLILPEEHRESLDILILMLSDESLHTAIWGTQYDQAKANILVWFEWETRETMRQEFIFLESNVSKKEIVKTQLEKIWLLSQGELQAGNIDEIDFNNIVKQICEIVFYYSIESEVCWTAPDPAVDVWTDNWSSWWTVGSSSDDSWWFSWVVKRVIIGVWILVLIFIIIVVIFAIKAKNSAWEDEE